MAKKSAITRQYEYNMIDLDRLIDGDTLWVVLDLGFNLQYKAELRLDGIDTPEKNTHEGMIVKQKVLNWLKDKRLKVVSKELDKYGRSLSEVIDIDKNQSLNSYLLENGFARKYAGEKKVSWTSTQIKNILDKE